VTPITVVPSDAAPLVTDMLSSAGWETASSAAPRDVPEDPLDVVRRGGPALAVPEGAAPPSRLRRILVVHKGSRGDRAGMDAADAAAVASGADIVVLHIPLSPASSSSGSMPFRMADHGSHDTSEWREEFLRRFCRCSPGVSMRLRMGGGERAVVLDQIREERPDLVIVSGVRSLNSVRDAGIPVLIVPGVGHEPAADRTRDPSG